jgi:hypothetical protein
MFTYPEAPTSSEGSAEIEGIDWYRQRLAIESDAAAALTA